MNSETIAWPDILNAQQILGQSRGSKGCCMIFFHVIRVWYMPWFTLQNIWLEWIRSIPSLICVLVPTSLHLDVWVFWECSQKWPDQDIVPWIKTELKQQWELLNPVVLPKKILDVILDLTRYYLMLFSSFEYFMCYNFGKALQKYQTWNSYF